MSRALQPNAFDAVRVTCSLDHDVRVRAGAGRDAQGAHEARAVGRGRTGLDRERFVPGDADLAAGQEASPGAVEPLQSLAGQLPLLRRDGEAREPDADDGRVGGGQVGRTVRNQRASRCGAAFHGRRGRPVRTAHRQRWWPRLRGRQGKGSALIGGRGGALAASRLRHERGGGSEWTRCVRGRRRVRSHRRCRAAVSRRWEWAALAVQVRAGRLGRSAGRAAPGWCDCVGGRTVVVAG